MIHLSLQRTSLIQTLLMALGTFLWGWDRMLVGYSASEFERKYYVWSLSSRDCCNLRPNESEGSVDQNCEFLATHHRLVVMSFLPLKNPRKRPFAPPLSNIRYCSTIHNVDDRLTNAVILNEATSLVPKFESNRLVVRSTTGTDDNAGDYKTNNSHNLCNLVSPG